MGKTKAQPGTPKFICNRMKSKQLQKLRWYCQMCQKSCRDENGFKCHVSSESHQRQLLLFSQNPDNFVDDFSKQFLDGFLGILTREFNKRRSHANTVYKEYINDRHHIHMNATKWETLTDFVKFLGKAGICVVEDTEKGLYITYIDRGPLAIAQQAKKKPDAKDDEERLKEFIDKQVEKGKDDQAPVPEATVLNRKNSQEKITLDLKLSSSSSGTLPVPTSSNPELKKAFKLPKSNLSVEDVKDKLTSLEELLGGGVPDLNDVEELKRKLNELEDVIQREKSKVLKKEEIELDEESSIEDDNARTENWVLPDIVVKVLAKSLGDKYYKKKGYVKELLDKFTAIVIMLDSGSKVKLDQSYLETVIPSTGKTVVIVNGKRRGERAIVREINRDNYCATVEITTGKGQGEIFDLPYEDVSKWYEQ